MGEKKKIKVLEAIRQGKVGGGESHILDLVKHINKDRFQPVVLSFTDGQMMTELKNIGIDNFIIPSEKAFDFSKWQKVKALMEQEQIDLVHIHGTRATSNIYWAAKNLNLPVIYTIHGWSFHNDQSPLVKKGRVMFEKWITTKTNCNISVSVSNQKTGKAKMPNFKSVVIHNGIDLKKFDPNSNERKNLRAELNIAHDAIVVCFIGRMTQQKDPLGLISAFKQLVETNPKAILLMVGDGELKEEAIQLANEYGIERSIVFENFRSDIPDILYSADIYCLPSLWEGFPIGLLEAMAMGKPVVATKVDGSVEIIENGKNGILVAPQKKQELIEAINNLIRDKDSRKKLGTAARQTIINEFDVCTMTKKIEDVYTKVLSKN
ncbi:MAG: glycosyltransferase [Bacteroidetes bacterium]|nr:glycosyltransferase [Bacteroidota bacterium]